MHTINIMEKSFDKNQSVLVYVKNSSVSNGGKGLFAKKIIRKNEPVVMYHGTKIDHDVLYEWYEIGNEEYNANKNLIRGTPHGYSILGNLHEKNINLCGVYVNDYSKFVIDNFESEKNYYDIIKNYTKTNEKCNLIVDDSGEYPVYYAKRRIKKNEELFVHYGIGYWLSENGVSPSKIDAMNKKFNFKNYYE